MAINILIQYPGRVTLSDANYTFGSAKNETGPGNNDGTPYEIARANDIFGFQQAILLADGGATPSGSAETQLASQYLDGVTRVGNIYPFQLDTGSVNAIVITPDPEIVSYKIGQWYLVKIAVTNTGAVTMDVSGLGTVAVQYKNAALVADDLIGGLLYIFAFDGTDWEATRVEPVDASLTVKGVLALAAEAEVDTGTDSAKAVTSNTLSQAIEGTYSVSGPANAYVLATVGKSKQGPNGYFVGMRVRFTPAVVNATPLTVDVAGLGAKNVRNRAGVLVIAGDLNTVNEAKLVYDGADLIDMKASIRVLASRSTAQSIANSTETAIILNAESFDSGAMHDNVTLNTRITVPSGFTKIKFTAQVSWFPNGSGDRRFNVRKNGSSFIYAGAVLITVRAATGGNTRMMGSTGWIDVIGGDFFELLVLQTSGGNLNILGSSPAETWFQAEVK